MHLRQLVLVIAVFVVAVAVVAEEQAAQALPPAGADRLPVVATADVTSRLGNETVVFVGWAEINRGAPFLDGGVEVVDTEIVSMNLVAATQIGAVSGAERPNSGSLYVSSGEIRSKQAGQDFPASSFFDVFVNVGLPANPPPGSTMLIHNETALHLRPRAGSSVVNISEWPPLGVTYALDPIFGVDNDGDTQIDEDTPDEDGDGLVDEDRPGTDPNTPGSGSECGANPDCDSFEGEDPPLSWCLANSSPICDDDGDGQADEDPDCIPLMNAGNVNNMKAGFCVRNLTLEFAPELPSFSVAPGGPSNLHPADILALTPGDALAPPGNPLTLVTCNDDFGGLQSQVSFTATVGTTYRIQAGSFGSAAGGNLTLDAFTAPGAPTPTAVSGNDNFAAAHGIVGLPFRGTQSTFLATTEPNEPLATTSCPMGGHTVWYTYTPPSNQTVTVNTIGSNFDTVLAVYTGDTFPTGGGGGGGGADGPFVRIPCASLGLTADGCDAGADGDQDDLDALSFGDDLSAGFSTQLNFSVGPGAQGLPGTAVETQRNCPAPEPEPDEFASTLGGSNTLVLDGNGPVGTCASAFPLGLIEGASVRDDLDAVHGEDPVAVDADRNGVPESPVYYSLAAGSPSLVSLGVTAADVLKTSGGLAPAVYASRTALGLTTGDDIDGLCLKESGDGAYAAVDDTVFFSLAPGSPTLTTIGAGPGDVLQPGTPPSVLPGANAAALGLAPADDLDALKCLSLKDPDADPDGDTIPNSLDDDDDNDGCTDAQELGANAAAGGRRNPHNFWDFFDTPDPNGNVRDKIVTIGDILRIVLRFGANDANGTAPVNRNTDPLSTPPVTGYHPAYDRTPSGPNAWNLGAADGSITITDIFLDVVQFGHTCA